MPTRPLTYCNHPGCRMLVPNGYCAKHERPKQIDNRESANARGYDYLWQRFRRRYLREFSLCVDCLKQGAERSANEVHHIRKLSAGGERLDPENCMALCHSCHSIRTGRGE